MKTRQELVGGARRLVIKFGSGLLTGEQNRLARSRVEDLVRQLAALRADGREVVLVSSGAIAAGMEALGLSRRPKGLSELQACAAVGQSKLMALYDAVFAQFKIQVAQVLLTHDDLRNRNRHLNARNTLIELLHRGVLPIINENDTVSVDEIKFGDNDRLGALTAALIDADLLVILSHVEGLLDGVRLVPVIERVTPDLERLASGTTRTTSVGGMISKLDAAKIVTRAGIPMIIASGETPHILTKLAAGEVLGSLFLPQTPKLASRKRWIAFFQRPRGTIVVDDGARDALSQNGRSLIAKGVVSVEGEFAANDLISIRDRTGTEFARGLARASSGDLKTTPGVVVHRDDLVIL